MNYPPQKRELAKMSGSNHDERHAIENFGQMIVVLWAVAVVLAGAVAVTLWWPK